MMIEDMVQSSQRKDAFNILSSVALLSNSDTIFLDMEKYYEEDDGNLFCVHLDYVRSKLIDSGVIGVYENEFSLLQN